MPVNLEEYILGEWFEILEEEEEVVYSCKMIIVDIDFQKRNVEITQDNHTMSNTIISAYNLADNRARLAVEIRD